MRSKQSIEQEELLHKARDGDEFALNWLRERRARFWTKREIECVEWFLSHIHDIERFERIRVNDTIYLRRHFLTEPELATIEFIIDCHDIVLAVVKFEIGVYAIWALTKDRKAICDLSHWYGGHYEIKKRLLRRQHGDRKTCEMSIVQ